ncbi:class I glutamine amidotransferase-like protein [Mycena epipterygia]|nr:class I glutamine amidotransferase-like protein [Mycena epipterygia]
MPSRVLFVFTSVFQFPPPSGWYLPEAAHPYYILAPHATIDFASPAGANPPLDEESVKPYASDKECTNFLADKTVKEKFAACKKLSDISAEDYDAIFYVGGHGPVIDLAVDPVNIKLASEASLGVFSLAQYLTALQFYQAGKITSAVCHGPAALVGVTDAEGKSIFAGKAATGFSNAEEITVDKHNDVPFLLEDKIVSLGGNYQKADDQWAVKVVTDGNLYTGQNPASAGPLGKAILEELESREKLKASK